MCGVFGRSMLPLRRAGLGGAGGEGAFFAVLGSSVGLSLSLVFERFFLFGLWTFIFFYFFFYLEIIWLFKGF